MGGSRRGHAAAPPGAGAAICQRANGAELAVAWASSGARRAGDVGRSVALSSVRPHGCTERQQHSTQRRLLPFPSRNAPPHRHRSTRPGAKACPARVRRPPAPAHPTQPPGPRIGHVGRRLSATVTSRHAAGRAACSFALRPSPPLPCSIASKSARVIRPRLRAVRLRLGGAPLVAFAAAHDHQGLSARPRACVHA